VRGKGGVIAVVAVGRQRWGGSGGVLGVGGVDLQLDECGASAVLKAQHVVHRSEVGGLELLMAEGVEAVHVRKTRTLAVDLNLEAIEQLERLEHYARAHAQRGRDDHVGGERLGERRVGRVRCARHEHTVKDALMPRHGVGERSDHHVVRTHAHLASEGTQHTCVDGVQVLDVLVDGVGARDDRLPEERCLPVWHGRARALS
jgi:hypothetical protein